MNNLAYKDEFQHGEGGGDIPVILSLTMTEDEATYLSSIMEGCSFSDDKAISLRNRLRVLLGSSPIYLAVDNTKG